MIPLLLLAAMSARPLLVTVDDLPIASPKLTDPSARKRATEGMLAALKKHHVAAVGLVTGRNIQGAADQALLARWLAAGHELGNHSQSHLDYTTTPIDRYLGDVEAGRKTVQSLLDRNQKTLRFFRYPFLDEGDTPEKLEAMRAYLAKSGQKNLVVTIDTQDWSFEDDWQQAKTVAEQDEVGRRYLADLTSAVRHYVRLGDAVVGREAPQIILLHANAVSAAEWDALFTWLEQHGYRFAGADQVLADPAYAIPHAFVGPRGFSLWDRIRVERRDARAKQEISDLLTRQAADWSRGDVDAFCSVYAEDATFIAPSGITRGRQAIIDRYRKKYSSKEKMGALSLEVIETRLHQGWEVSRAGDAVPSKIHGASTILRWTIRYPKQDPLTGLSLVTLAPEEKGGWRIVQDASM